MWRDRLIRALGGYSSLDEAIEAIRSKDGAERRRLLTLAVRRLYNTIGPDDILKIDTASGLWMYEGKQIGKEEMYVLKEQAKGLLESRLWKILQADLKYQANKRMFVESVDVIDITAGKLLTFYIDIIHTRLKRLVGS